MITRALTGRSYWLFVSLLLAVILGLGAFVAVAVVLPETGTALFAARTPAPTAAPGPSASPEALAPMEIATPADSDCAGCHQASGLIEVKDVPAMAHPVQGWSDCTACHADDRLVKTAPGHTGIHRDLCLACHREPEPGASALPRPHHVVEGKACIACHGSSAPLPTGMAGRTDCWLCHPGQDNASLFGAAPEPSPGTSSLPSGRPRTLPLPGWSDDTRPDPSSTPRS